MSGDYLNYGKVLHYRASSRIAFDDEGIPKIKYGDSFYYNPVTVSQFALMKYGQALHTQNYRDFLCAVEALRRMQGEDGAFRYDFPFYYYLTEEFFYPGWISGMAQGQALSVLARAYLVTKDKKLVMEGERALSFLFREVGEGGPKSSLADLHPSLNNYMIFEEYISNPNSFTLNGFMFTILGLYDWSEIQDMEGWKGDISAIKAFEDCMKTLKKILPYYDIKGFTCYDLGHITFKKKEPHIGIGYHEVHITQLHALYSIEYNRIMERVESMQPYELNRALNEISYLKKYEMKWRKYVD